MVNIFSLVLAWSDSMMTDCKAWLWDTILTWSVWSRPSVLHNKVCSHQQTSCGAQTGDICLRAVCLWMWTYRHCKKKWLFITFFSFNAFKWRQLTNMDLKYYITIIIWFLNIFIRYKVCSFINICYHFRLNLI